MDDVFLCSLLGAGAVALLVWAGFRLIGSTADHEKQKMSERLNNDVSSATAAMEPAFAKGIWRETEIPGISGSLAKIPSLMKVHKALVVACPSMTLAKFLGLAAGIASMAMFTAFGLLGSMLIALASGVVAGALPFIWLNGRNGKRQRNLSEQLPEALDFLSRILRAGHSLSTGLQMMGEELPQPLAGEFQRSYDAHSLGLPLEDALKETAMRIDSVDFGFFVTAVLIQRQTGGDLSEVLGNISGMIRGRIRLQQHVLAKTAEGRFTGYILVGFPVAMFFLTYALNPKYAGALLHGSGLYLIGTAAGLCMLGLYCIRRITNLKV